MALRVMIVEDEPLIALQLESILEDAGYLVVGKATEMRSALGLANANPSIDVAIMDITLAAKPDGVVVAQRLRQDHGVASLFVSASIDDDIRVRALAWEPVGFIGKPFQEAEIVRALAALVPRAGSPN